MLTVKKLFAVNTKTQRCVVTKYESLILERILIPSTLKAGAPVVERLLELLVDILHLFGPSLGVAVYADLFGSHTKKLNFITVGFFLNIFQNNKQGGLEETTLGIIIKTRQ